MWHIQEYKEALEDAQCTPAKMVRYFDRLLTRLHVDVLAHGNVGKEEATSLPRTISEALSNPKPLSQAEIPSRHALRLPLGGRGGHQGIVVDLEATTQEENNSAVQVCFFIAVLDCDLLVAPPIRLGLRVRSNEVLYSFFYTLVITLSACLFRPSLCCSLSSVLRPQSSLVVIFLSSIHFSSTAVP